MAGKSTFRNTVIPCVVYLQESSNYDESGTLVEPLADWCCFAHGGGMMLVSLKISYGIEDDVPSSSEDHAPKSSRTFSKYSKVTTKLPVALYTSLFLREVKWS